MSIINQNISPSSARLNFELNLAATATGVTSAIGIVPVNARVTGVYGIAFGLSNTPTSSFSLYRFISGATNAGFTAIGLGATITLPAYGTSGWAFYGGTLNGMTISNVIGITALQGDLIVALSGGTNAAVVSACLGCVVSPTDAILQWPG